MVKLSGDGLFGNEIQHGRPQDDTGKNITGDGREPKELTQFGNKKARSEYEARLSEHYGLPIKQGLGPL